MHGNLFRYGLRQTLIIVGLCLAAWVPTTLAQTFADTVFVGKHILTMAPEQQRPGALAVRGKQIQWLGDAADRQAFIGPNTKVVELGERALLPGFIDAHGHLASQALTLQMANVASPPVGPVTNMASLQDTLRAYLQQRQIKPGSWVVGRGYDDSLISEKRHPTRHDLDAVSTTHPIALMHVSGHLATANSLALKLAGITADSKDPAGGLIRREGSNDTPNGVLEESAAYPLRGFMTSGGQDTLADLTAALATYASFGITTVQDGATSADAVGMLQSAAKAGLLTLDVIAYPAARDTKPLPESWALGKYKQRFKIGGVKLMLDGSPQGKTAFLSQPYEVPPQGQTLGYRGYPIYPLAKVKQLVGYYLGANVPILAHANGDAAADMLIDAVSAAVADQPDADHRTVMIHAQTVRNDQLDDMATLNMIPSFFSAHVFYWGDWHRDSVLGPTRAKRISPTRDAVRRNLHFTLHNDAPVVPPNMLRLLWATTNRLTRSGQVLGAEQRLTTYEALRAVTVDAAYQAFEEDQKGSLAPGKLADLVVLSANPLTMPSADLESLSVDQTWSHGVRVH